MGLCKCPKRRVTTLFCFEHRVNVCESCLVSAHPKVRGAPGAGEAGGSGGVGALGTEFWGSKIQV
uniref:Zinc finger protein-like 1 n=1 Tax=Catharus ustulatus TaxID=91951 RepID=A0A8C3Y2T8_CATUS